MRVILCHAIEVNDVRIQPQFTLGRSGLLSNRPACTTQTSLSQRYVAKICLTLLTVNKQLIKYNSDKQSASRGNRSATGSAKQVWSCYSLWRMASSLSALSNHAWLRLSSDPTHFLNKKVLPTFLLGVLILAVNFTGAAVITIEQNSSTREAAESACKLFVTSHGYEIFDASGYDPANTLCGQYYVQPSPLPPSVYCLSGDCPQSVLIAGMLCEQKGSDCTN